jgi:putative FmdB family regulatory protein
MPNYDYQCKKCEHKFEVFQRMSADRLKDCPLEDCDGEVKRLLGTGAGIIFKGSGFYETDYRSDSYKKGEKADKPKKADKPEKKSSDSSSGKSDSGKKAEKSTS